MAKSNPRSVLRTASHPATPRRDYWRAVLEECRRSGLRQAEFYRQHGILPGTLGFWKHTLARKARVARPSASVATRPERPAFVPVRIAATQPAQIQATNGAPADSSGEIEIVMAAGRLVRVRGRVDTQGLRQVLLTLEGLGC